MHGEGRSQTLAWEEDLEILEATRVRVRVLVQVNMGLTYVDRSNNTLSSFGVMTNAGAKTRSKHFTRDRKVLYSNIKHCAMAEIYCI